ncbi:MAG: HNH endonuclease [Anaerolineae bacterium]|nr:MAG: HNH endonuclease [Anaerolineae bacterium]
MDTISAELRRFITDRAKDRCEYCLAPQTFALHKHEPDHIIPRQHGGETSSDNLALACFRCNRYKGPNLGSIDPDTGELVGFFHPRRHHWREHFRLGDGIIIPLTAEARVTVLILRLNDEDRAFERRALMSEGLY